MTLKGIGDELSDVIIQSMQSNQGKLTEEQCSMSDSNSKGSEV